MVELPVYLFTGFLEAGKTKFIQETLEDKRFHKGERTLLILCEEGVEEYAPDQFCAPNVFLRTVEDEADFTAENLSAMQREVNPERILIEYNGMWMLDTLYSNIPEGWIVAQEFLFCDATTFLTYNANMRQLMVDKIKSAELVVLNRYRADMDRMAMHKVIRGVSRRCDIAYEYADGKVEYDDIEDPLPFDIEAPVVNIEDRDYAIWYRDMSEETKKYNGKTVRFKGRCLVRKNVPKGSFIIGRHIMTCCVEDIQFAGIICNWDKADSIRDDEWVILTAKLENKFHRAYGRKGPVLTVLSVEETEKPEEAVATFY
ncbi:MAG: GTPase [Oscillospiraceae bacterium]|nr:GTPase [Oscillospiraceae bacterium]